MTRSSRAIPPRILFAAALLSVPAAASGQQRTLLDSSDFGRWERLGASVLAPMGDWVAYEVTRNDESHEVRIWGQAQDSTIVIPWARDPAFSPNGRWLAWVAGHSMEEEEAAQESDTPLREGVGLLDLMDLRSTTDFDDVAHFSFDATGERLALLAHRSGDDSEAGTGLRIVTLDGGGVTSFGSVGEISWAQSGPLLAMTIASGSDEGNGLQVYDAGTRRLQPLDHSGSRYTGLSWRKEAADLAVLRSEGAASEDGEAYAVLAWRSVTSGDEPAVLDPRPGGTGDTLQVVAHHLPTWSPSGGMMSVGLRPVPQSPGDDTADAGGGVDAGAAPGDDPSDSADSDTEGDSPEPADVQIWHSNDVEVYAQQKAAEDRRATRTLTAAWHLQDDRLVMVSSGLDTSVEILRDWDRALEETDRPYPWGAMFGRPYHDVWTIDLHTGVRRRVRERVRYAWASDGGRWLLSFNGADYLAVDLESGVDVNLTEGLPAAFADTAYDTPTDLLPPFSFGPGGWLEGDAAVFLYDEHDIWRVAPDGSGAERVTEGAETGVTHRVASLPDLDDEPGLDADAPLYLTLYDAGSEEQGFGRLDASGDLHRLRFEEAFLSNLTRADSATVYAYRRMAHGDPQDLYLAGPDLDRPVQVTDINPFMAEYAWSRAELVNFQSESGRDLQAVLQYPVGYEPGTRVPMIVYTYEMLSPQIHIFENPSERDYYNFTTWTQHGYAVLLPDIVYRWREPGPSAVESVRAAVAEVVAMGVADPDRVGLIGHSWGGYQATYLPTRTDIFAASVAGAPLTDFVSFMGALHWNPGLPELSHWETGQARMEVPFWEDPEAHRRSSPIHGVQDLETPLLMAFGNEDGVVDWDQGTEFYNFARRAGKEMVLLVYEGEDHGFRGKANQIDYHRRILEWFGHYLRDEPAPDWIASGIAIEDLERERVRVAEKKPN